MSSVFVLADGSRQTLLRALPGVGGGLPSESRGAERETEEAGPDQDTHCQVKVSSRH